MDREIYTDEQRAITVNDGVLTVQRADGQIRTAMLHGARTTDTVPVETAQALRERGDDPAGWYTLVAATGIAQMVLPNASRDSVDAIIAEYAAEFEQQRSDPATVARRKVHQLFVAADRLQDYPSDYFPAFARAERALAAWREQYPDAARAERKANLLAEAAELRHKAQGALFYDSDGWLDSAARQAGHDDWIRQAEAVEAEAAKL